MLRGPQTPGELKQRTERLAPFESLAAVDETLDRLVSRELVSRHERRPGQKEQRYEQLLGGGGEVEPAAADPSPAAATTASPRPAPAASQSSRATPGDEPRLDRLERELTELRSEVHALREALGE